VIIRIVKNVRGISMAKKKTKKPWEGYKRYTLTDGTKFMARDDSDAELYRQKVGDVK
jgi:hypothetical protein